MTTQVFRAHVGPDSVRTYTHIPFDVPPGTTRIDVRYSYSDKVGSEPWLTHGNTLDLGLLDTRGTQFGNMGFRGWTGSARDAIFVAAHEATPGYLAGNLEPGTWFVMIGFYKIAPQGCDYEVTVTLSQESTPRKQTTSALLELTGQPYHAAQRPDGWYRGELHCHTHHSDGDSSVAEVIQAAQGLGLDFLAIMDHNDVSHLRAMRDYQQQFAPAMTLIPGCEMTTYWGHWNAWGLSDWVEFRIESPEQMRQAMHEAQRRGALVSCNHPRTYGPPWEFKEVTDYACIEVWNGPWPLFNQEALTYWEDQLRQGRRVIAVGGSDMHRLKAHNQEVARLATPTTWIYCPDVPTASALLRAMRAGNCFIAESSTGPQLHLRINDVLMGGQTKATPEAAVQVHVVGGAGARLVLRGASGERFTCLVEHDDSTIDLHLDCSTESYIWAQLCTPDVNDQGAIRAITNPVYFS